MSRLSFHRERWFPNLTPSNYTITSPETMRYNCIEWALERDADWIEPDETSGEISRDVDSRAFLEWVLNYFRERGFEPAEGSPSEAGFDTIAIYATEEQFTHVARQLPSGSWTSKLGDWEDIEHDSLSALEGAFYGYVVATMKRPTEVV